MYEGLIRSDLFIAYWTPTQYCVPVHYGLNALSGMQLAWEKGKSTSKESTSLFGMDGGLQLRQHSGLKSHGGGFLPLSLSLITSLTRAWSFFGRVMQRTALHTAAAKGNPAVVHLLLEAGADAETRDASAWGSTALHLAAEHGHAQYVFVPRPR